MNEGESIVVAADYLPLIPRAESIPGVSRVLQCPEEKPGNLFIATKLLSKNRGGASSESKNGRARSLPFEGKEAPLTARRIDT